MVLLAFVQFFPGHKHLDFALKVEEYTLGKAANLVLNVDGCIAGEARHNALRVASLLDLWHVTSSTYQTLTVH